MDICTVSANTVHNKIITGKRDNLMWANNVIKLKDKKILKSYKDLLRSQLQRQNTDMKGP